MSPPAAVVVGAELNGLGVVRSLIQHRVPVTVLGERSLHPALFSRGVRAVRVSSLRGTALIDALLALAPQFTTPPLLILTTDFAVQAVSEQRQRLAGAYRLRLPAHDITIALLTKQGIQHWAETSGVPIPKGCHLTNLAHLDRLDTLEYPGILKPCRRDDVYDNRFTKAYRVASASEAKTLCQEILPVFPDLMVQEWIPGAEDAIYFCLQYRANGVAIGSFVGRKLRSWLPGVGVTSCCVPDHEHANLLTTLTDRFFEHTNVDGFASLEFKRDARNGLFRVVEPTVGRTDLQEEIATLNGVNLPWLAYQHEFGLPLSTPIPASPPQLWHDGVSDWRSARASGISRKNRFPPGVTVVEAYWRPHDPIPFLVHLLVRFSAALWRRLTGSMGRGGIPLWFL